MSFVSPELDIQFLKNINPNNHCIYFKFKGKFTEQTALAGTKAWSTFMNENPDKSYEFVWDCKEMNGFEISARKAWYNTMSAYKDRISKVYVISPNIMIRSAAKVMLQFFGINSVIGRSEEELPAAIRI